MKNTVYILVFVFYVIMGCTTSKSTTTNKEKPISNTNDTIRIANDELHYEVIISDIGYGTWLNTRAFPKSYYSQSYLENKNQLYISEWNNRVLQPQQYDSNLYEMTINYDPNIDYGYEVNYLIYNYMIYFQNTYKQKLNGYVPMR